MLFERSIQEFIVLIVQMDMLSLQQYRKITLAGLILLIYTLVDIQTLVVVIQTLELLLEQQLLLKQVCHFTLLVVLIDVAGMAAHLP